MSARPYFLPRSSSAPPLDLGYPRFYLVSCFSFLSGLFVDAFVESRFFSFFAFPFPLMFGRFNTVLYCRPVTDFARQVYTDPAINVEFQLMTAQLGEM